jgi:hypothetical protein
MRENAQAAQPPNRFARYIDSTLGQQIFDVAITEAEAVVQPDSVADDFAGKPMSMIKRLL